MSLKPPPPDRRRARRARSTLLSLLAVSLTGCVVIPFPEAGRKVTTTWKQQASKLLEQAASRDQVTHALGFPAWEFGDLGVIGYEWSGVEWGYGWLVATTAGGSSGYLEPCTARFLWMAFNEQDRLTHCQVVVNHEYWTAWEQALDWRQSKRPRLAHAPTMCIFSAASPPPGKAIVHLFWGKGTSDRPVISVFVDAHLLAQIRQGYFTTFILDPGTHQIAMRGSPLDLDLRAGEVCLLEFDPDRIKVDSGKALFECPESEAMGQLRRLHFCR